MIVNIEQAQRGLRISYIDKSRGISFLEVPLSDSDFYNWEYDTRPNDSGLLSWDNKPIFKKPNGYLSKYRIDEIILNLPQDQKDLLSGMDMPKKWFCDIETEWKDGWAKAENADNMIQTISLCNEESETVVLGLKRLNVDQVTHIQIEARKLLNDDTITFKYEYFQSETDMLNWYFTYWIPKMAMITGWNWIGYDWKYLYNRCKKLGLMKTFLKCSPVGQTISDDAIPLHRMMADYLDVYKKWDRIVEIKENNTLDYVAKQSLGFSKVKMAKGLRETYEEDFTTFILYNVVDSILVKKIDEKLNTMQTFLSLANFCQVEYHRAFSPIYNTETLMNIEFIKRNRRMLQRKGMMNTSVNGYEGAYVKVPVPGLYEYVACFDFSSLYPTTQRQFNISPDTYLGKIKVDPDDKTKIVTASGAVFDGTHDSCMRTVLSDLFKSRKIAQKKSKVAEKLIADLKQLM